MKKIAMIVVTFSIIASALAIGVCAITSELYRFTPYYGDVVFYENSGVKYATVSTIWNSTNLWEFNSGTDAYEQEIWLYNYDKQAYALGYSSYQSDLPDPYGDTSFGDKDDNGDGQYDEISLTVGSYSLTEIVADVEYSTTFTLTGHTNINTSNRMYKVSSQDSYKVLGVNSEWLVYSENISRTIPFKNGYVTPDSRSWYFETEDNDSTATARATHVNYWNGGEKNSSSDVDYWRFTGAGTKRLIWQVPNSSTQFIAEVYDNNGNLVHTFYSRSEENTYIFASGIYYLKVKTSVSSAAVNSTYNFMIIND